MTRAKPVGEDDAAKTELPICTDATTLGELDGKKIRLVGHYRKSLTARKMRGPKAFHGEIHIEIEGRPADYDPKGSDERPAIVEIEVLERTRRKSRSSFEPRHARETSRARAERDETPVEPKQRA